MKLKPTTWTRIDWKQERDRIDLAAVATRLLGPAPGRRGGRGGKLWWNCPFHEDRNPSLCIDPGKPWWKCFGCGESGDAANLVMRHLSMTFPEAVSYLTGGPAGARSAADRIPTKKPAARSKPTPEPSGMPEPDALALVESAAARLWTPEGAEGLAYLTGPERGLSPETIRAARLGWTPRADGVAWKPPGVVIPWFVGPRLAMVKVRPPEAWRERFPMERRPPKYLEAFRDPSRLVCYPAPTTVRPGAPLVIVEGEFDALALGEALGRSPAVVTLGSASAELSHAILGRLLTANPWYVATDSDTAGGKAAAKWEAFPRARRVLPPSPYKDWTEARQDGVNLARWWRDLLNGNPKPELFTDQEAAGWRWGPAIDDLTTGISTPRQSESKTVESEVKGDRL